MTASTCVILSDRAVSPERVAIPALLACAAVHHHLVSKPVCAPIPVWWSIPVRRARRIISPCSPVTAPRQSALGWPSKPSGFGLPDDYKEAQKKFVKAVGKGLYKVMSKMGISTYQSYCGAQIFDAIGLNRRFHRRLFPGYVEQRRRHRPAGSGGRSLRQHQSAFGLDPVLANSLEAGGEYAFRCAAKNTCGRRIPSPSCRTRRAPTSTRPTRNMPV
jgi:glutamate synthase (NADPH/NADH) large chain